MPRTLSAPGSRFPVLALSVLALLGFVLISTETMPAGVLPQIAQGMKTSEAVVGQFVTAYALGTVGATIPAVVLTRGLRRKRLFVVGLVGFFVANTVTAVSTDVALSLVSRVIAGGMSGMLWGMLAGYAIRITPPAMAGRALSLVATGAPVGIAFGTPLGSWLGTTFDWRWSFGGLSIMTGVVLVLALVFVPDAPGQSADTTMSMIRVFRLPGVAVVLVVIFAWMLGNTTTYTYITVFLSAAASKVSLELLLVVFGIASIGGIAITAALIDRRPGTLLVGSVAGFAAAGLVLFLGHQSAIATYAAVIVWGLAFGGASPQLQRPLTTAGGANADVANSFLPVAFNLAIFAAGILGAVLLKATGGLVLPLTLTAAGVLSLSIVLIYRRSIFPAAT